MSQEARREAKTKFNGLQLTQISFDLEDIKSYLVTADEVEGEERVERGRREEAVAAVTLEVGFKNISQLTRWYSYDVHKISFLNNSLSQEHYSHKPIIKGCLLILDVIQVLLPVGRGRRR